MREVQADFPQHLFKISHISRDFIPPGASQDPTGKQCKCFHSQVNFLALISLGKSSWLLSFKVFFFSYCENVLYCIFVRLILYALCHFIMATGKQKHSIKYTWQNLVSLSKVWKELIHFHLLSSYCNTFFWIVNFQGRVMLPWQGWYDNLKSCGQYLTHNIASYLLG